MFSLLCFRLHGKPVWDEKPAFGMSGWLVFWFAGKNVGLSNKLDSEVVGRKPVKGSHREVVGAAIENGELLGKVGQRKEGMAGIKAFLVFL